MLLQTNSYVVPKERRAEHQRLMRRFRQTLARLGCEHFEVYEQVGVNWTAGDNAGRYVQIMRFRDRRHQLSVQSAERADPGAQAVIAEFCNLINFPYQQQQGLFAVGFYQSALPVTMRREATRAEVAASDAAAAENGQGAGEPVEAKAEAAAAEDKDLAESAAGGTEETKEAEEADEEVELKAEAEGDFDEDEVAEEKAASEGEEAEDLQEDLQTPEQAIAAGPSQAAELEPVNKAEVAAIVEETVGALAGSEDAGSVESHEKKDEAVDVNATGSTGSTGSTSSPQASAPQASSPQAGSPQASHGQAMEIEEVLAAEPSVDTVEAAEEDETLADAGLDVEEKLFGGEAEEPTIAEPALAGSDPQAIDDGAALAGSKSEPEPTDAEHADELEPVAEVGATAAEPVPELNEGLIEALAESEVMEEQWEEVGPAEAVELTAAEGDIEIIYEQLPASADEGTEEETSELETEEDGGFDALLSNEQLHEGFDAEDDLLHSAAHAAELHAHSASAGRNGNSAGGAHNGDDPRGQATESRHGRMR